jgi:hypothetical protein
MFLRCSAVLLLVLSSVSIFAQAARSDMQIARAFEGRAKAFIKFRDKVYKKVPAVKKDATPEQIEAYKKSLQSELIRRRAGAKEGNMFTPETVVYFRRLIKKEFPGFEASELRKQVLEADTKGTPIKVNAPYPDDKELVQMPPPLLLALPQLPKDLRYRFIGRSFVVMDRDGSLILDVMRNALP